MDQFSLYAIERHGASALPGFTEHSMPGTRRYEEWARVDRMLRVAREHSTARRLERRRRRLQRRLASVNERIEAHSCTAPAVAGS
ncbi:hypothetical protein [Paramicrobacterium fandaimingii]|uniref:hypothetical protein n=1 Tax=Paramicrobacterium fandaimingii TaxID=2708079 RepID=UPI0014212202|nr:hypothetical protein [Microbacterium fandaimingii]